MPSTNIDPIKQPPACTNIQNPELHATSSPCCRPSRLALRHCCLRAGGRDNQWRNKNVLYFDLR